MQASQSLGSGRGRLLGERRAGDPPLLAPEKVSSWRTRLQVLGWTIDTVAISLSPAKFVQLRELLARWPVDRRIASKSEMRSLMERMFARL